MNTQAECDKMNETDFQFRQDEKNPIKDKITYYIVCGRSLSFSKIDNYATAQAGEEQIKMSRKKITKYIAALFKKHFIIPTASWGNIFRAVNGKLQFDYRGAQYEIAEKFEEQKKIVDFLFRKQNREYGKPNTKKEFLEFVGV